MTIKIDKNLKTAILFFITRMIFILSVPFSAVTGYGDYWNFFNQAGMGVPYLDFWTEFPPVFPFLSRLIYLISSGREQAYVYLLVGFFTLVQAATLFVFIRINEMIYPENNRVWRTALYFAVTVGLFYGWAYFDSLAVLFFMLGIYWLLRKKSLKLALGVAAGGLAKWFPLIIIPAIWKMWSWKKAVQITAVILSMLLIIWGVLYFLAPDFTSVSLRSQGNKGSWETIWALLDGNRNTGNFGAEVNRRVPELPIFLSNRQPALISPWLSLTAFSLFGFWLFCKLKLDNRLEVLAFIGLTLIIFFLWSPGYSPQWMLFLLPLVLLIFPLREGVAAGVTLALISLLEWPILLSRGLFEFLPGLIILRAGLFILIGFRFYQIASGRLLPGSEEF